VKYIRIVGHTAAYDMNWVPNVDALLVGDVFNNWDCLLSILDE
jgi:hypothetical protein